MSASSYGSKKKACSRLKESILLLIFLFLRDIVRYVQGLNTGTEDSRDVVP